MPDVKILLNAGIWVGTGTASADRDISNRVTSIKWNETFEEHDVTCMGSVVRQRTIGLGESSIEVSVMQSYTTTDGGENIDDLVNTFRDISATGKSFLVRMRRANAVRSATNPEYSMQVQQKERTIFDGEVGTPQKNALTFISAGDISRFAVSS